MPVTIGNESEAKKEVKAEEVKTEKKSKKK